MVWEVLMVTAAAERTVTLATLLVKLPEPLFTM